MGTGKPFRSRFVLLVVSLLAIVGIIGIDSFMEKIQQSLLGGKETIANNDNHNNDQGDKSPQIRRTNLSNPQSLQLSHVGTKYGGWTYDSSSLTQNSVVYSIGLGEDTSWDEGIIAKHKLNVWGFDPTPKSLEYIKKRDVLKKSKLFHLVPEGLATSKGTLTFTKPKDVNHVSMRAGIHDNLGETITVPVNTLENWMQKNGHKHIDIFKMDVEGSEYDVLEDWIQRNYFPFDQLLVEWHFRYLPKKERHDAVLRALEEKGWKTVHSQNNGQETTMVRMSKIPSQAVN